MRHLTGKQQRSQSFKNVVQLGRVPYWTQGFSPTISALDSAEIRLGQKR